MRTKNAKAITEDRFWMVKNAIDWQKENGCYSRPLIAQTYNVGVSTVTRIAGCESYEDFRNPSTTDTENEDKVFEAMNTMLEEMVKTTLAEILIGAVNFLLSVDNNDDEKGE